MRKRLGVTPTVAVLGLTLIAVGSSAVMYSVIDNSINEAKNDRVDIRIQDINIESCWEKSDTTYVSLRNTGKQDAELDKADIILRGSPISDLNYSVSKDLVGPEETFTVEIYNKSLYQSTRLELVTDTQEKPFFCEQLSEAPAPAPPPSSKYLQEIGDRIPSLNLEANLTSPSSSLCIGSNCPFDTAGSPSSEDSDDYINQSGDEMSGDLNTSTLKRQGSVLCIGNGCQETTTSTTGWITDTQNTMEGFLRVENVVFHPDDGCIGGNC